MFQQLFCLLLKRKWKMIKFEMAEDKDLVSHIADAVDAAFDYVRSTRQCKGISDREFASLNILRALNDAHSGRDFLQELFDSGDYDFGLSTYFDALSSARRLRMFREVTDSIDLTAEATMLENNIDHLSLFPELRDRVVVAGDGHAIEHACHAERRNSGRYSPESSIYLLNLHTGLTTYLSSVQNNGSRSHEMPVLRKALQAWQLTQTKHSKPPILVYDRAAVDKTYWSKMAMAKGNGIHIITRTKVNMVFEFRISEPFNDSLSVNKGVVKQEIVGQNNALSMKLVTYRNPEDGKVYEFLTTVNDLEPGLIAWLYFLRWKVEKCFDVFKNKMYERKSWAISKEAQEIQARACCSAHNLLQVFHLLIRKLTGMDEDKLNKKRARQLEKRKTVAKGKGMTVNPLHFVASHLYQLSQQFVRLIRNLLFDARTIGELIPLFRKRMEFYL